jgi:hypothetical protein
MLRTYKRLLKSYLMVADSQALWSRDEGGEGDEGRDEGNDEKGEDGEDAGEGDDDRNALLGLLGVSPGPAAGIRLRLDVSLYLLDPSTFLKLVRWQQDHALLPKCAAILKVGSEPCLVLTHQFWEESVHHIWACHSTHSMQHANRTGTISYKGRESLPVPLWYVQVRPGGTLAPLNIHALDQNLGCASACLMGQFAQTL